MHSTAQNEMGESSGAKNEEPIRRCIKEQEVVYVLHGEFPDLDLNIMTWTLWWTLMLPWACAYQTETSSEILVYLWERVTGENFLPPK